MSFIKRIINKEGEELPKTMEIINDLDFDDGKMIEEMIEKLYLNIKKK